MFRSRTILAGLIFCAGFLCAGEVSAQTTPQIVHYDGRLQDGDNPADGPYSITFHLYSEPQGGSPLWTETHDVDVTEGLFSVNLGTIEPLEPEDFQNRDVLYLALEVGETGEMSPRLFVASTFFSLRAGIADQIRDGAVGSAAIVGGAVSESALADGAVSTGKLNDGAVSSPKLADRAVTSSKLADGAVSTSKLANEAVTEAKLSDGAVTASKLAEAAAVTSLNGLTGGVQIAGGAQIQVSADDGRVVISSSSEGSGSDITRVLAGEGLTGGGSSGDVTLALADEGVSSEKIENGAVTEEKLDAGAVTTSKLASNAAVTSLNGLTGSVLINGGSRIEVEEDEDGITIHYVGRGGDDSSVRWKQDIQPLSDALNSVMQLRGVSYVWKDTHDEDIGLIAEEVGQVVPEVVEFEDDGEYAKTVKYSHLVALLIEAVKEQQVQITERDRQLQDLSERLDRLERQLGSADDRPGADPRATKSERTSHSLE